MRSLTFFVGSSLMAMAAVGCGEPFTAASTAGTGGASASHSSSGMGGASGSTSTSTSSSGGGKPCTPGANSGCGNAQYCRTDTNTCSDCYDFTRFQFGQPQALDYTLPVNGKNPYYPRIGDNNQLLFSFTASTAVPPNQDLASAPKAQDAPPKWGKGTPLDAPPNSSADEAGPLFLKDGKDIKNAFMAGGNVDPDQPLLLYHSNTANPASEQVLAINPASGKGADTLLLMGGTRNYNIAVATQASPVRFWYVSNANNNLKDELVTALPGATPSSPVFQLDNGCDAVGEFYPWVTPLGNWLLFASPYSDEKAKCAVIPGAPSHLFYINLKPNGFPSAPTAAPIFKTDAAADRTTPSMSADLCTLYFAEVDTNGNSEMYSATRQ